MVDDGHAGGSASGTAANGGGTAGKPRIAVVLPGGGARGAYEAGALSVLLPELEARGEQITIACGTSVGAINATLLGSMAEQPAAEQAQLLLARWREMRKGDVIRPIIGPSLPLTGLRFLGELFEIPGVRLASIMDPAPLAGSLDHWVDWVGLQRNVKQGVMDSVCVIATALTRGGPVAFVHTAGKVPPSKASDDVRYVRVRSLSAEHVRASAAIPLLFPPVEVTTPAGAADFYIDGGTRLNSPIAPALALGADRVIVIGFEPFAAAPQPAARPVQPRLADVAANILDGLLVDQVSADLHRLASVNTFYAEGAGGSGFSQSARNYRTSQGKKPYKKVAYALVAPERKGELGQIAEEVFQKHYAGWRGWRSPDYPVLSRILGGGRTRSRGELLSFLMFDEHFVQRLLEAGAADARAWLDRHPRFWCSDAAHDFQVDPAGTDGLREERVLDEFRAMRRR
ncbi:MAG: Patatin [Solirubrobacterales bacterium]|nr:Patatin [Solirubrobacterales bacterium]